jgi:hypothetical protein
MQLERFLRKPHEDRLAAVRRIAGVTQHEPPLDSAVEPHDVEERLRVAMVRLLPRAPDSNEACERLLRAVAELWTAATTDVRALDAWHVSFEVALARALDPRSPEFEVFLMRYTALLQVWLARGN